VYKRQVIGGGRVAEKKMDGLLAAKAKVTVVSPEVTKTIQEWASEGKLTWLEREYQHGDLKGYFMVTIATNNRVLNKIIYQDADQVTQLINVVDLPEQSNYIVPATMKRGALQISVSTSGASPGLAKKIRSELKEAYGSEYEDYLDFLKQMREWIISHVPNETMRRDFFERLLDPIYLEHVKTGKQELIELTIKAFTKEAKKGIK
jgi:precorrin-2 dehydrogenase/sirohydrochlorin ferrochelatase